MVADVEPATPDPAEFRRVMARLATGVTVVSTLDEGVAHGMTVNSLTSVSLTPPLVLFCCDLTALFHDAVLRSTRWAVSFLAVAQEEMSRWFATRATPGVDQFSGRPTRPGPATGAPLLTGSTAWLECETWATYPGGDHTIVVGEVVALGVDSDDPPLLYVDRGYRTVARP